MLGNTPILLCVDDSKLAQSLVQRELEFYDVDLHFANNGVEALEFCSRQTPDLVLLDLRMPQMDGIEFLKKWKVERAFSQTQFIIMTSETSRDIVEAFLRLGIVDYIAKPFSGKVLIERISQRISLNKKSSRNRTSALQDTSVPVGPPSSPETPQPPPRKSAALNVSFRTIRVLTSRVENNTLEKTEEEHSLQEIISKYQVLLGFKSTYLTSVLVELLKDGKVCVESDKFSERIQLKYDNNKIDASTAAALLANYFNEQRIDNLTDSNATQRIVLHRAPSKPRPAI